MRDESRLAALPFVEEALYVRAAGGIGRVLAGCSMLDSMRQAASGWTAKLLLGLLVVSFAVWGISGSIFNYGAGTVATVGDTEVTVPEFQREMQEQVSQIGRQLGTGLTTEQARQFGIPQRVLGVLIGEAALEERAREMNLGVSQDALVQQLRSIEAFQTSDGKFDRDRFRAVLRQNGYTEDRFVEETRARALRNQLSETLSTGMTSPTPLVAALRQYQDETRDISFVTIDEGSIDPLTEPSDAVLASYFEARVEDYRAPEYRKLLLVELDPDGLRETIEVSDEEIAERYELDRQTYARPERRRVQQVRYQTQEEAEDAVARIFADETTFEAVLAERGVDPAAADSGLKTKAEFLDPIVADAAFEPEEGAVFAVADAALGPTLVRVVEVEPETVRSLDEVAPTIRAEIAREKARRRVSELYDAIEDDRAGGMTLREIAEARSLPIIEVSVSAQGLNPEGDPVAPLAGREDVVADAFESDVGLENDPIRTDDEGFVFYEVLDVTPERDRDLDEVRERVLADWRAGETEKRVAARAEALLEEVRSGKSLEDVARDVGQLVDFRTEISRAGAQPRLSPNARAAAFAGPAGHLAVAPGAEPGSRILLRVDRVNESETSDGAPAVGEALRQALEGELLASYVDALQESVGVAINTRVYSQLVGGS